MVRMLLRCKTYLAYQELLFQQKKLQKTLLTTIKLFQMHKQTLMNYLNTWLKTRLTIVGTILVSSLSQYHFLRQSKGPLIQVLTLRAKMNRGLLVSHDHHQPSHQSWCISMLIMHLMHNVHKKQKQVAMTWRLAQAPKIMTPHLLNQKH